MNPTGLGDRAHLFLNQRQNAGIRTRLDLKSQELASGVAHDMVAHLRGDTARLADLDRRLFLAGSYGSAAREVGNRLSLMQDTLDQVAGSQAGLLKNLMDPAIVGDRSIAARAAGTTFSEIVSALNTSLGGEALFAGTGSNGAALASVEDMLADIRSAVAGSADATEVAARLDTWFDTPGGGFDTMGYLGEDADTMRIVDEGDTVTIGIRADDPSLRGLLKAAALGVLAKEPSLSLSDSEGEALIVRSRDALLSLGTSLTEVQGEIGQAQERVEATVARHAARATAWGLMRNEMTQVDPYATASEIEALRTQLETHYELTSRLSSLSLVSYLR